MSEVCLHCEVPIKPKDLKLWRWAAWSVYGPGDSAPQRDFGTKRDQHDWSFHKQCFPEWLANRNGFMQDLDRPMNNCSYFQRTGSSIHGYYIRDNKKHACVSAWTDYDIRGASITPTLVTEFTLDFDYIKVTVDDPNGFLNTFKVFLVKNNWLDSWFSPRKEFVPKYEVAEKMKKENL